MQNNYYNLTLALAATIQAVNSVKELAQTGKINEASYQTSIYSIFQTEPRDCISVFGSLAHLKPGLEQLTRMLTPRTKSSKAMASYLLSLMHLQKKISASQQLSQQLTQHIEQIKKQVDYFHLTHPTVIANLADAYLTAVRAFRFRIIIWGSENSLNVPDNINKIRALLLAGIRGSVLWRQMGGSRLQLLFSRAKIRNMAKRILAEMP